MEIYTVWQNRGFGVGEKCLMDENGDYIGLKTGKFYDKKDHHHSKQIRAMINSVDNNKTGMLHLCSAPDEGHEENRKSFKEKYIGCLVTLEAAHYCDEKKVYRCNELNDYFSEDEVLIIE